MKTTTTSAVAALLLTLPAGAGTAATEKNPHENPASTRAGHYETRPFSDFFGVLPYSPTFGLALFSTGDLLEATWVPPQPAGTPPPPGLAEAASGRLLESAADAAQRADIRWKRDYADLGVNQQLHFRDDSGSALLLRIRDGFQLLNEDSKPASWLWIDDREHGATGDVLKGAAMLDVYWDPLYNGKWIKNPLWIDNPYRFWLRLGAAIDRNTLDSANASDMERYYALVSFQANPDESMHLLGLRALEITSPQLIQFGAVYEKNNQTGDENWAPLITWEPKFAWNEGVGGIGRGFGLNRRMYFGKGGGLSLATVAPETAEQAGATLKQENAALTLPTNGLFTFINPGFGLQGRSDARVTLPDVPDNPSLDDLRALRDEVVTYSVKVGLGWDASSSAPADKKFDVQLNYSFNGIHPVSDLGHGHQWHELRAEFNLLQTYRNGSDGKESGWAGLSAYLSYVEGEPPPTFEQTDLITAGVSLRF